MISMRGIVIIGLLCLADSHLKGQGAVRLEPSAIQTKYCLEGDGTITLRLQVNLDYISSGSEPIILPRFTRVTGYTLYRDRGDVRRDRVQERVDFRVKEPMLDTAKLDAAAPDPRWFAPLSPGATIPSIQNVTIRLGTPKQGGSLRVSGDYELELRVDHWPGARGPGHELSRKWANRGLLFMDEITSSRIKLSIEARPVATACPLRVD